MTDLRMPRLSAQSDTILSLRTELRILYESLQHKNEELILLENSIVDRDGDIEELRSELQRHKSKAYHRDELEHRLSTVSVLSVDAIEPSLTANIIDCGELKPDSDLMVEIRKRDEVIEELNARIIRLSRDLSYIQRNSLGKDDRIVELQNEIDKFRQVVQPLTQAMFRKRHDSLLDHGIGDWSPGVESTRVLPVSEPRMKRQAISAEPLSAMAGLDGDELVKIPKSSL